MAKPRKRVKALVPLGHELIEEVVKGSSGRERRNVLARPGDFVWKYRKGLYSEVQYYAGQAFGKLWEDAGLGGPAAADLSRPQVKSSYQGLPPAMCDTWKRRDEMTSRLGPIITDRLIAHVVNGSTVGEIARRWGVEDRVMAAVLSVDLDAVVDYFGYVKG